MRTGFVAFLFLVFMYALVSGWNWPEGAKVYVFVIACFGLILTGVDLLLTAVLRRGKGKEQPPVPINSREVVFFAYLLAYALGAYLVGAVLASALFVFTFLRFYTGSSWFMSSASAVAMTGFLWVINEFVGLSLLQGLIRL